MKDRLYLALAIIGIILALSAYPFFCYVKATRLNELYGTDFSTFDIMLGVEKNFREIQ